METKKVLGFALLFLGVGAAGTAVYFAARSRSGSLGRTQIPKSVETNEGYKLTHHRMKEMPIEKRVAILQDLTSKSVKDPRMRKLALQMTRKCKERDVNCETKAIYSWIKRNIRYTGDIGPHALWAGGPVEGVDLFQSANRTVEFGGGDCLPKGTRLLVEGDRLVPIEDVLPGTKIWGRDQWTEVKKVWSKGELPIDMIHLSNDANFGATADHKVYVARCTRHPETWECSCPMEDRSVVRIRVSELQENAVMIAPETLPSDLSREQSRWRILARSEDGRLRGLLRVRSIWRNLGGKPIPVYDISTADHYVYLPDADVTVSNCDDHAILACTAALLNGMHCKYRVTSPRSGKKDDFTHIYAMIGQPKGRPSKYVAVDTTLPGNRFAVEAPHAKRLDFVA